MRPDSQKRLRSLAVVFLAASASNAFTAPADGNKSWHRFRGPNGSGAAEGCQPPVKLHADQVAWKTPLPPGLSSPVLSKSRIFLTALDGEKLVTIALDKKTGGVAWRMAAPGSATERVHATSSPAASTPLVDGKRVFAYFGSFGLLSYDHGGQELWKKPIPTPKTLYGMSTSPIAHGNKIILVLDDDRNLPESKLSRSMIVAFDKTTGDTAWESPRPFCRSGWSTPMIWKHAKGEDLVVLGSGRLQGYDPVTGEGKWWLRGFSREPIAVPVATDKFIIGSCARRGGSGNIETDPEPFWNAILPFDENGDGRIERREMKGHFTFPLRPELMPGHPGFGFPLPADPERRSQRLDQMLTWYDRNEDGAWDHGEFTSGLRVGQGQPLLAAVRPGGRGDITDSHVDWELNRYIPEIPSPLHHNGILYLVRKGGILCAINSENGDVLYRERLGNATGHYAASPIVANGHLYIVSSAGIVSVVKTGTEFDLVHQHDLGENTETTPAVDSSTIYFRTAGHLVAFRSPD